MKKILAVGTFIIATSLAFGQDMQAAQERAEAKSMAMVKQLKLTPQQEEQVRTLNEGVEAKNEVLQHEAGLTAQERDERIQLNNEQRDGLLKSILTEEQFEMYKHPRVQKEERPHKR